MFDQLKFFYTANKKLVIGGVFCVLLLLFLGIGLLIKKSPIPQRGNIPVDNLSTEEQNVLADVPGATTEQKEERYKLAEKAAEAGDTIIVENCVGQPAVLEVKYNQPVIFLNRDSRDRVIKAGDKSLILKANAATAANPDFGYGKGLYGYRCDSSSQNAGMILVK